MDIKKLQILIPQYSEDENLIKGLLDSIQRQRNIDFNLIEVLIGNDGSDTVLSNDFLSQYGFLIHYYKFEHAGLAATRYKLTELANAEYIMYCDADDYFINDFAFSLIFQCLEATSCSALICDFLAEIDDKHTLIPQSKEPVHVHGKVYKLEFLRKNRIIWHSYLKEHQDSCFNVLAITLASRSKSIAYLPVAIYMYAYNVKSISHKLDHHTGRTYSAFVDSNDALVDDLLQRNLYWEAGHYLAELLYWTYYKMNTSQWLDERGRVYVPAAYDKLASFVKKYIVLFNKTYETSKNDASKMMYKHFTYYISNIEEISKGYEDWFNDFMTKYINVEEKTKVEVLM